MATSRFIATQHTSSQSVESAGAILFHLSSQQICLLHLLPRDEYVLPKGRRNLGESRQEAALREVREETGYRCHLLPLTMPSRAPPKVETEHIGDTLQTYEQVTEAISLQIRHLETKGDVKLIWWFVAAVEEDGKGVEERGLEEEQFQVEFSGYEDAVRKLTFQLDREVMEMAVKLVKTTYT